MTEGLSRYRCLTSNQLKAVAILAMVIDHTAVTFLPATHSALWILRFFGRMAAPMMCFFIAEGFYHTSNLKKYMGRLLLMAVISHVPYNLLFRLPLLEFWKGTDVMFSLFFGLVALAAVKTEGLSTWKRCFAVIVCCLLAYSSDWNYIAVLWIVGFGLFHGKMGKQMAVFSAVSALYLLQAFHHHMAGPFFWRFGIFLVFLLLPFYSGKRGRKSNLMKWGFYWFYPVHLLILYLLSVILY